MTDHDPTPDPEVLAALQAWAAATDPTADPVGGPTVRAGATGWARWRSHRALLVAAAVLVVLVAGTAVWALRDDDAGQVDGAPGGGVCNVVAEGDLPPLTVPPAWSLRERYGSSCGADSVPGQSGVVTDGPSPERSGCLVQAFEAGERVEVESTEGDERRIVWRVSPEGVTSTRPPTPEEPGWTQQTCTGVALIVPAEPPYLDPQGCGPQEPLSLDPPP